MQQLRDSGPDRHSLSPDAIRAGEAWKALAAKTNVDVKFGSWECHAAGCALTLVHGGGGDVDSFSEDVTRTDAFMQWDSSKLRSGPIERADGKVEITWILYAPAHEVAVIPSSQQTTHTGP